MKRIFVSYSYSQRKHFEELHRKLENFLKDRGFTVCAFVFDFTVKVEDKELMDKALAKIDESDLIIVELSNKSVGIGIEAGYAKAKGKPIIYLHKKGTDLKQTMNGIAEVVITYEEKEDLINQLSTLKLLQG
jgi:nucleoside 2-deoxyribosyltransferase